MPRLAYQLKGLAGTKSRGRSQKSKQKKILPWCTFQNYYSVQYFLSVEHLLLSHTCKQGHFPLFACSSRTTGANMYVSWGAHKQPAALGAALLPSAPVMEIAPVSLLSCMVGISPDCHCLRSNLESRKKCLGQVSLQLRPVHRPLSLLPLSATRQHLYLPRQCWAGPRFAQGGKR